MDSLDVGTQVILCVLVVSCAVAGLLLAHAIAAMTVWAGRLARARRHGRMTVRCAWCECVIRVVVLERGDRDCTSHGICPACAERYFGEE